MKSFRTAACQRHCYCRDAHGADFIALLFLLFLSAVRLFSGEYRVQSPQLRSRLRKPPSRAPRKYRSHKIQLPDIMISALFFQYITAVIEERVNKARINRGQPRVWSNKRQTEHCAGQSHCKHRFLKPFRYAAAITSDTPSIAANPTSALHASEMMCRRETMRKDKAASLFRQSAQMPKSASIFFAVDFSKSFSPLRLHLRRRPYRPVLFGCSHLRCSRSRYKIDVVGYMIPQLLADKFLPPLRELFGNHRIEVAFYSFVHFLYLRPPRVLTRSLSPFRLRSNTNASPRSIC